jgi:hypothetical protein
MTLLPYTIILFLLFILTVNGCLTGGSCTTMRYNIQIIHHAQTKHTTQNFTNTEGHTTHNEYNENTLTTTTNTITTAII